MNINVKEVINSETACNVDSAIKIKELIVKELDDGEFPTIDFTDIGLILPAFINLAIGDLYEDYNADIIDCLEFKGTAHQKDLIKQCMETAKEYWNKDMDKAIDDITPKQTTTPPNHYKLEINNQVVDVNMILEAVAKKLDKCDLMTWAYFTNSIEYLLRSWFKGQQISDLEKAKSEIDFMINRIKGNK